MVLQKRLDYGFNGYQVPTVPRSSRSARRRRLFKKKVENNQMCAFELLASVAGKLLQERESSQVHSNTLAGRVQPTIIKVTIKQEQQNEEKLLKVEPCDPGSCDESIVVSDLSSQGHNENFILKADAQNDALELSSFISNSDCSEKDGCAEFTIGKSRNGFGKFSNRVEIVPPGYGKSCKDQLMDGIEGRLESERQNISSVINGTVPDTCSSDYPLELDNKAPVLFSSDSSVEVPMCRDHVPCSSLPGFRDDVKVGSKDDDENSSACIQPRTVTKKAFRPSSRIGDRRMRKLLASKYWKVAPKLKDGELSNTDLRPVFRNRKTCFTRQRSQRNSPFKRRKLFKHNSISTFEGQKRSESISNSLKKGFNGDATGSASQASSSVSGQESSFHSRGSHVKLSIKSFRVPELFIEIPETATVGTLKRKVMEAMNAILGGGGLRIGVVLQGKKVRDDNRTLMQTGISHDDKLNTLGFTLEPNSAPSPTPLCHEDSPFLVPYDTPQPVTRYLTTPSLDPGISGASPYPPVINLGNFVESDHDLVPSPIDLSTDRTTPDSRALVAIPASMEALSVVPLHRKSKRSELMQRRIRRPFSVSEVEALVQAVEKLGTGRWRDIKLRAFDNAKHRTYVDLKDKWKTLVHTARISPQQRRGEPVPQELLDRVLSAHANWSQQQAKQQIKQQQQTEACLLL